MTRRDRVYQHPHYPLPTVVAAALARDIVVTDRASAEATDAFPADLIDIDYELREIVQSLAPEEFQFAQSKIRQTANGNETSWVDVYRIDFEACDLWLKIKLEADGSGDFVVIISCHEWDDSIPV